ncbi:MAG: hypothetical protein K8H88_29565 [Sandaracinaceae bacterium]|nr:hypothetical protein [Sandaracinaceae bacterium]
MSLALLSWIPGTREWVRTTFTPRVELRLRKELRALLRTTDARAVALWHPRDRDADLITFAGDLDAVPEQAVERRSSVPSFQDVRLRDGSREVAVVHGVRLGRGLPSLTLAAVACGVDRSTDLFDAVELVGEALEEIVVSALP